MEVLAALKEIFWKMPKSSIGICKEGEKIFLARLERMGEEWKISATEELSFSPKGEEEAGAVADAVRMHCARRGWSMEILSLCLSEDRLFREIVSLPELEEPDLPEAIHWEIEGREIFGEKGFRTAFGRTGEGKNDYWVAAVEEGEEEGWEYAWRERDMELSCVVAMPPTRDPVEWEEEGLSFDGGRGKLGERLPDVETSPSAMAALYAAMVGAGIFRGLRGSCFSKGKEDPPWDWKALCLAVGSVALVCLCLMVGSDLWRLHAAREDHLEAHRELLLLGKEQKRKDLLEKSMQETERRDSVLAVLSKENFPWYSLLVHFGTMTVEGVCIKDIALSEENILSIEGEAVTFDALAEFLKKFEGDRDFFSAAPLLENATTGEKSKPGEMVQFSLRLEL